MGAADINAQPPAKLLSGFENPEPAPGEPDLLEAPETLASCIPAVPGKDPTLPGVPTPILSPPTIPQGGPCDDPLINEVLKKLGMCQDPQPPKDPEITGYADSSANAKVCKKQVVGEHYVEYSGRGVVSGRSTYQYSWSIYDYFGDREDGMGPSGSRDFGGSRYHGRSDSFTYAVTSTIQRVGHNGDVAHDTAQDTVECTWF